MISQVATQLISAWAPIEGIWEHSEDSAIFVGHSDVETGNGVSTPQAISRGVALSSVRFAGGKVSAMVTMPEDTQGRFALLLLGFSSWDSRCLLVGLSGNGPAYALMEHFGGSTLRTLAHAGAAANLKGNTPYHLEVGLDGQRLTLAVDRIKVLDHVLEGQVSREQLGLYAQGKGPVRFSSVNVSSPAYSAFVVMQFTEQFNELFDEVILPVCESLEITANRASDIYRPGAILQDIHQQLDESYVVIAEITTRNANVFYELGYSHALRKPVILLAERGTDLPFDVSGYRVIFYDNTIGGKSAVEADLRRYLTNIIGA